MGKQNLTKEKVMESYERCKQYLNWFQGLKDGEFEKEACKRAKKSGEDFNSAKRKLKEELGHARDLVWTVDEGQKLGYSSLQSVRMGVFQMAMEHSRFIDMGKQRYALYRDAEREVYKGIRIRHPRIFQEQVEGYVLDLGSDREEDLRTIGKKNLEGAINNIRAGIDALPEETATALKDSRVCVADCLDNIVFMYVAGKKDEQIFNVPLPDAENVQFTSGQYYPNSHVISFEYLDIKFELYVGNGDGWGGFIRSDVVKKQKRLRKHRRMPDELPAA